MGRTPQKELRHVTSPPREAFLPSPCGERSGERSSTRQSLLIIITGIISLAVSAQNPVSFEQGNLIYTPDSLGNTIVDFSRSGYMAGECPLPRLPATIQMPPVEGDATQALQDAIDYAATLKPDKSGFRGVILLENGDYRLSGSLSIAHSGIVLRGSGNTRIIAAGQDRRTLIRIAGEKNIVEKRKMNILSAYVPVNAFSFDVAGAQSLRTGDRIFIVRPSVGKWIDALGTGHFGGGITALGWKEGDHDIRWDRTVVAVEGNKITVDAPLTTAIDSSFGGGYIIPYEWTGRISNVGIEHLTLISEYDEANPKDEAHSWTAITVENTCDAWIANIVFKHFAGSAVAVMETAKRITVENCKSLDPVSEIGGHRRNTFFCMGQQCLFQRLYSEYGCHDFATGFCAPGPNAFVQCEASFPYSYSGSTDSWASGLLFDGVSINGNALSFKNLLQNGQGAGWNAANSVFWNCSASLIECFAPPAAQNWSFGSWAEFSGDGMWFDSNNHIKPRSLYYQQLKERLGDGYEDRACLLPVSTEASSSPSVETAAELTKIARDAPLTLSAWIDSLRYREPVAGDGSSASLRLHSKQSPPLQTAKRPLTNRNGRLTVNSSIAAGKKRLVRWWSGNTRPAYLTKTAEPHITRFVPSRTGTGLTDDLDSVVSWMANNNILVLDHNYGLWYDRRRDDHERIRRIDGDVRTPFYEQPFARSGQGTAYDGLSKYDLTKYNTWYWDRLKTFAEKAAEKGLVLMHQNYFQHNIIEAGAHWTDSPWRPANNINNTGFPEPPPYAGDKRIFLAEQFYDVNHPVRRELHRKYIRQCLDNFKDVNNVIQLISEEYTGTLSFMQFWLDVIAEWEKETGIHQLIALSATKDVQDSILADPVRSATVDIIDIRYWFKRSDGSFYAPRGGQNLSPRQHARLVKPGNASFESVYQAVSEYKMKYPEKAVVYFYPADHERFAWASFIAGGSLAALPAIPAPEFLKAASSMTVMSELNKRGQYVLGNKDTGEYIIYSENGSMEINIPERNGCSLFWINPETGNIKEEKQYMNGHINLATKEKVLWIKRK
jgi:hypothetical protein